MFVFCKLSLWRWLLNIVILYYIYSMNSRMSNTQKTNKCLHLFKPTITFGVPGYTLSFAVPRVPQYTVLDTLLTGAHADVSTQHQVFVAILGRAAGINALLPLIDAPDSTSLLRALGTDSVAGQVLLYTEGITYPISIPTRSIT